MMHIWAFDCPYHGLETGNFCFRAFSFKSNIEQWKKYELKEVEVTDEEREEFFRKLTTAEQKIK